MKNNTIEKIHVQPIDMDHHRKELRRSLLTSSYWDNNQNKKYLFWKGGEKEMQKRRYAAIALSALIVVIAITLVIMPKNASQAYADQVAGESFKAVTSLTPDEQKDLKARVNQDSKEILAEAKQAKDLKYYTYDQYIKGHPEFAHMPTPPKIEGEEQPDIKKAQFLEFTDQDGAKTTIAIDPANDLPFIITKRVFNIDGDDKKKGGNAVFRTEHGGQPGAGFGFTTKRGPEKGDVMFQVKDDGTTTLDVNGKKYNLPEGFKVSTDSPPDIQVKDDGVYVNGQKATPVE